MRLLRISVLIALAWAAAAGPVPAQSPVPDTLRSSALTRAQETELNRRLERVQERLSTLASETNLREGAIRNIAIEIFGADPDLDYETYVRLIGAGARELRSYLTDARARGDRDPTVAAIRQGAIEAAEDGRLSEARALYDQLIDANRSARRHARDAEDLADAADIAEAARLAYVSADYLDAARRYGEAAELAPEGARERWRYTVLRGLAFYERSRLFNEPEPLRQAIASYEAALALRSRASAPSDWAGVQGNLGNALRVQGERGAPGALERAASAYEAVLTVMTREADPAGWALTQNNLGNVLMRQGERGAPGTLERAVAAFEAALSIRTREADPNGWALTQMNLGIALSALGERGAPGAQERAVAAYEAALMVRTREADPAGWAQTQMNLGLALERQGVRGAPGALERAVAAYEAALTVRTREADPAGWAMAQGNLGNALSALGERGAPGALERAVAAFEATLTIMTRDSNPAGWARTQMNLGLALERQGARDVPGALERAVTAYEAALAVRTRDADPAGWAETMHNLASAYRAMGRMGEARAAAQAALAVYEQVDDTYGANEVRSFLAEQEQQEAQQEQERLLLLSASEVRSRGLARLTSRSVRDVEVEAGGAMDASLFGAPCVGFIARQPSLVVNYRSGPAPLFVSATSDNDTTLVLRTPDGLWRCDDDSGDGLNPALQIEQPTSGRYAIWVGTFASDAPPMDTMLHLGPTGTLLSEPKRPNLAIDPAFGSVELAFGFEPDPHTLNLSAGGTVNASSLGIDACVGFVSHGPAYGLNWTVADALSISVESNSDTTLLISDPSGAWSCNDDSEGLNPAIMFATPTSGRYNIWVGTFSEGAVAPAILRVTAIRRE